MNEDAFQSYLNSLKKKFCKQRETGLKSYGCHNCCHPVCDMRGRNVDHYCGNYQRGELK